jgi:AcrR family transcriptional regulator
VTHVATPPAARRGRPRDAGIDAAIIEATVAELVERGFLGLSIEAVAARAGVAKTTLYRRWSSTAELGLDALRSFADDGAQPPPGSVRDQLVWLIDGMRRTWGDPQYGAIMRRVSADGTTRPDIYCETRDRLIKPHRRRLAIVLRRGVDEGLIHPDADLAWVRSVLVAPVIAATLTLKERVTRAQVEATVDTVLRGLAP